MNIYKSIILSKVSLALLTWCLATGALAPASASASAEFTMNGRRDIYCVGARGGIVVYARMGAFCVSYKPFAKFYLTLQAAGSAILAGNMFRLSILYPKDRYAADFDPVPGDYFSSSRGFGPGVSRVEGSSGNKKIKGYLINGGAGLDWSFGLLRIERSDWNPFR